MVTFNEGYMLVLVATNVASRGLDVKGVGSVINYDLANNTEDQVYRFASSHSTFVSVVI